MGINYDQTENITQHITETVSAMASQIAEAFMPIIAEMTEYREALNQAFRETYTTIGEPMGPGEEGFQLWLNSLSPTPIKKCVFCGQDELWEGNVFSTDDQTQVVICPQCFARGPIAPTREQAIAKWNNVIGTDT